MTKGERMVAINHAKNDDIRLIKERFAYLIDYAENLKTKAGTLNPADIYRYIAITQTKLEEASMYFTKTLVELDNLKK